MTLMKKLLKRHSNPEGIQEFALELDKRKFRIEELEDTVAEFQDFLKHNPDVKELHDLRCELADKSQRIQELEDWIRMNGEREIKIERERIMELEEMVTHLEDYVKEHNVDVIKQKLKDREDRMDQLQKRIDFLEKESMRNERIKIRDYQDCGTMIDRDFQFDDRKLLERDQNLMEREKMIKQKDQKLLEREQMIVEKDQKLKEREQKMKEMEHALSEKDNKIQEYEQQVIEWQDRLNKLKKEMNKLEKELEEYEAEDIGVLKEEIKVRDEKVAQLEEEIDSLERAFNERIDLEQIEALVGLVKEKEEREKELETELREKKSRIEELSEALKESVLMTDEGEKKLKNEIEYKKTAIEKIGKLEQKIASIQTVSALKCPTCRPLLNKLQKSEKKLERLAEERTTQMEDLHQMKREALKAAVSEKDAHLALLELTGLKTATQIEQAENLKAERKMLLEKLKEEDERSIELTAESSSSSTQSKNEPVISHNLDNRNRPDSEEVFFNKEQFLTKEKIGMKSMKKAVRKTTSTYSERAKESR